MGAVALIGERRQVSESAPIAGYGEQLNNQTKDRTVTTNTMPLTATHPGLRVQVYRNLRNGLWSVVALEGPDKGRVIAHKSDFIIEECSYAVQPAGNAKVRATGRKNVHAFVRGRVPSEMMVMHERNQRRVTYNPQIHEGFVDAAHPYRLSGIPKALETFDSYVVQSSAVRFCAGGAVIAGFALAARKAALFA